MDREKIKKIVSKVKKSKEKNKEKEAVEKIGSIISNIFDLLKKIED